MNPRHTGRRWLAASLLGLLGSLAALPAHALPSFSRQTGEECTACHIGGFGPQLTPHGMKFKIGGYTDSDGKDGHVPLSAMLIGNSANLRKGSADLIADGAQRSNNNLSLQEFSVFVAGRLAPHVGTFTQVTYSGIENKTAIDNMDVRIAREFEVNGSPTTFGVSVNNSPTTQDPFNTLPAWRFPYTSPDLTFGPGASTLLDGTLEQAVLGTTAYAFTEGGLLVEAGGYNNIGRRTLKRLGVMPDAVLDRTAPYGRIALLKDYRKQAFSVGMVGMQAHVRPLDDPSGSADKLTDVGIDGSWQYLGNRRHIFTVDGSVIRERQDRLVTAADNPSGTLYQSTVAGSYYYEQKYGLTARLFNTHGSSDATYYGDGFRNGSPDSRGYTLQADWTPLSKSERFGTFLNLRLGMQYTGYTMFNGANSQQTYDGTRRPGDNNTFSVFVWGAY